MQGFDFKIPGVTLDFSAPVPTEELLSGIPTFLGVPMAKDGSWDVKRLTLWTQFEQVFEATSDSFLEDTIRGFFENGGEICYVVPLRDKGFQALRDGLEQTELIENFDLICVPDVVLHPQAVQLQQMVVDHCEQMGDRLAILDALPDIDQQRDFLKGRSAAIYAPWLKTEFSDRPVPPCGHIAGVFTRNDRTVGVHGTPANIALEGVLDLTTLFTSAQQADFIAGDRPAVNYIRAFTGRGMRIWGGRTISTDPEWCYVGVRRLFIQFKRWCDFNLADIAFEENNFKLWLRIQREIAYYCETLWSQGALQGATPEQAYFVRCDGSTNPREVIDQGKVITEVGLAPTVPNEFIHLTLVHGENGVAVN
ncbi:phage tail sheath protein fi-like protein [[Leptolyngbya] sp. PCC 7376]|uniref:phage tail sheath family protein n=1 Tax=[Leptolyngbya] sp. PCC 7376 TaxID=111781 RepID=UPI00029F16A0|nr:phage tail sheath subtilisin-like domain-containing protein [[Leptolyngbya] sp. PCC 7376]AFY37035.1 phage tail sheath protein fi-like protein [[Leptolyngbya] sp. PCC 7376]